LVGPDQGGSMAALEVTAEAGRFLKSCEVVLGSNVQWYCMEELDQMIINPCDDI
jgi:hypothetical protein